MTFHPTPSVQNSSKSFKLSPEMCCSKRKFNYLQNNSSLMYPRLIHSSLWFLFIQQVVCYGLIRNWHKNLNPCFFKNYLTEVKSRQKQEEMAVLKKGSKASGVTNRLYSTPKTVGHVWLSSINCLFLFEIYSLSIANTTIWLATVLVNYQVLDSVCGM